MVSDDPTGETTGECLGCLPSIQIIDLKVQIWRRLRFVGPNVRANVDAHHLLRWSTVVFGAKNQTPESHDFDLNGERALGCRWR